MFILACTIFSIGMMTVFVGILLAFLYGSVTNKSKGDEE